MLLVEVMFAVLSFCAHRNWAAVGTTEKPQDEDVMSKLVSAQCVCVK